MSFLEELEQVHIVAYALETLIDGTFNKLQAIYAFGDSHSDRAKLSVNDDWYALVYSVLLESIALDVASLLDRAKYGKDSNCNFRELKRVIENCGDKKARYDGVLNEIDKLIEKYNDIIPDVLRNKIIAHKDLEQLFTLNDYDVDLIGITRLLLEGYKIVSDVMELAVGAKLSFPDLDEKQKKYEASLRLPL